ncbi:MAG: glycosyltransferase family 9 protein [Plesiomonas shigelloides]
MKRILVVRNDKIGDFMLAWPSFAMLKASMPQARIYALVPHYTAALAKMCPWIDEVVIDPGEHASKDMQQQLQRTLRGLGFDAAICLFSTSRIAWMLWRAHIPYRLAPATKWAQILFNHRLAQRRSRSQKPESEYNLDLIRHFLNSLQINIVEPHAPYLSFAIEDIAKQREYLIQHYGLNPALKWGFIHAGSGGSARNLNLQQYADFAFELQNQHKIQWVLTAGPTEQAYAKELEQLIARDGGDVVLLGSDATLTQFVHILSCADLFVAGSTGPLHIAGALDIPTIGFFPSRRSATPLRWQPLNRQGRHLAFCPPAGEETQENMQLIDPRVAAQSASSWLSGLGF